MKSLFTLAVVGGIGWLLYKRFFWQKNDLDKHLEEVGELQKIGRIAQNTAISAQPPVATYGDLPLSGRIITPLDNFKPGPIEWMPKSYGSNGLMIWN